MTFIFPFKGQAQKSLAELDLLYACGRYTSQQENEVHTTHFMKGFHLKKKGLNFQEFELYRSVDRALLRYLEKNCKLKKIKGKASLQKLHSGFNKLCLSQCKVVRVKTVAGLGVLEWKRKERLKSFKKECPQICRFAKKEHSQLVKEFKKTKLEETQADRPVSVDR